MNRTAAVFTIILLYSVSAYSIGSELVGKIGTSYAKEAKKFGLDLSLNYMYKLDPYFAAGFEADLFWLSWDRKLGTKEIGQTSASVKAKTDAYTVPFFFNAQVRLPGIADKIYVEPSLIIGLGYSIMFLYDSIPQFTDGSGNPHSASDEFNVYYGFAWHSVLSLSFKPGDESKINFVFDIGFRGAYPEKDGIVFNMSGFLTRFGVKFDL